MLFSASNRDFFVPPLYLTRIISVFSTLRIVRYLSQALQQVVGSAAIYNHLLTKHGGVGTRSKACVSHPVTAAGKAAACDCDGMTGSCKVGQSSDFFLVLLFLVLFFLFLLFIFYLFSVFFFFWLLFFYFLFSKL